MRVSFFAAASLFFAPSAFAGAPAWVESAIKAPCTIPPDVDAAILFEERRTVVDSGGRSRTRTRIVTKILRPGGRYRGYASASFGAHTKLHEIRAWSVSPNGKAVASKEKDAIEASPSSGSALYTDVRTKTLPAPSNDPGTVVAFEIETEDRWRELEDVWIYDDVIPTCRNRYELEVPQGWSYRPLWIRATPSDPSIDGNRSLWEMVDLPALPTEELSPHPKARSSMLAIRVVPPESHRGSRGLATWNEAAASYAALAGPRITADESLRKMATGLAAATSSIERIRALASFAQRDIRYVAVELGIGGWQPHAAPVVLERRFGDCKDKATLLIAMLRSVGIDAWFVAVNSNRGAVTPDFPTFGAFNHMIVAIRHDGDELPASSDGLLFFDPTDDRTPIGELPASLQGSQGLLIEDVGGRLIGLPAANPLSNRTVRRVKLIAADSLVHGEVEELHTGASAARLRSELLASVDSRRSDVLRKAIAVRDAEVLDVRIEKLEPSREPLVIRYRVRVPGLVTSSGALRLMRVSIFKSWPQRLTSMKERRSALAMPYAALEEEEIDVAFPDGFVPDDLPSPIDIDAGFVRYKSKVERQGTVLVVHRLRETKKLVVPADEFVRGTDAIRKAAADERRAIVLKPSP